MTNGFDSIDRALNELERRIEDGLRIGLRGGARRLQQEAEQTTAYYGMSGATRASTVAYAATPENNGESNVQSAHNVAAAMLDGFAAHDGNPLIEDSGESVNRNEYAIVLTVPTDYIVALEFDKGGQKAFLDDSLRATVQEIDSGIARAVRGQLE